MIATDVIKRRFELLAPALDERTRRLVAAAEALTVGWGGGTAVARATGVSRRAIREGIRELSEPRASASRLRIQPDEFHGDWNYTILPSPRSI